VSEDPDVIKNYVSERKASLKKVVYSSAITGKLFNSKQAVIDDFKKNHIKSMTLIEVQNQNRYQIEEHFLAFIQKHLVEDKIAEFVEALSEHSEFEPYLGKWVESE
jgi:prephenate dehydratase